ncbi:MAG TPA: pitrilysin family protein, partial [Candidatus Acidoferrum sp.]|nr:pitrilysin family protein [Candidatus Acidoferrum sp.]
TGLSHMLEHMMFKGTPTVSGKEFEARVTRNGGVDNAETQRDVSGYYEDFAADRVLLGLELEADRMAHLKIDEQDFLSERKVVTEERRMRIEDQPANVLGEVMRATAFMAHAYKWPTIGWPSDIAGWTREDTVRHYRLYYAPNNATLVVAGDVKKDVLLPKIQTLFGSIPRQPDAPKVITQEPPQQGERRVYVRKEAELPVLFVVHHVPTITHPDSFPLQVLAYILGGGESARFYQKAVYEKQVASYAGADYNPVYADPFLFGFSGFPLPGKTAEEVEQVLVAEVDRLIKEPIPDRELQKAKNQIEAQFIFAQDSVQKLAEQLGRYEGVGSWKLLDGFVDGVRKVSASDVQRVARQYLTQDNRTVAILIPVKPGTV